MWTRMNLRQRVLTPSARAVGAGKMPSSGRMRRTDGERVSADTGGASNPLAEQLRPNGPQQDGRNAGAAPCSDGFGPGPANGARSDKTVDDTVEDEFGRRPPAHALPSGILEVAGGVARNRCRIDDAKDRAVDAQDAIQPVHSENSIRACREVRERVRYASWYVRTTARPAGKTCKRRVLEDCRTAIPCARSADGANASRPQAVRAYR